MRYCYSILAPVLASVAALVSCAPKADVGPAVLSGEIKGDFKDLIAVSYAPGPMSDYLYPEVAEGHFDLELGDVAGFVDLAVAVDDDVFGARVNAGDTLKMVFTARGDGHFDVSYDGTTEAESRIWTGWYDTYGYLGKYNIRPDADPDISPEESLRMLDENDAAFRAEYGVSLSDYHIHRADLARDFIAAVLIENANGYDYAKLFEDKRYLDIIGRVDPEDPYAAASGLLPRWASYQMHDMGDDDIGRRLAFMNAYKGKFKNVANRNVLASFCAFPLQMDPRNFDDELCEKFLEALRAFEGGSSETADRCAELYEGFKATRPGSPMPEAELTAPDGTKTLLSSFSGKVVYIDIWATWCGPCVKETPAMAALASRMKGRDDIICISVDTDKAMEPWLEKLEADKPDWPQYWLSPEADAAFSAKMNINSIPRFIIVAKDGTIYDADAIRPSDPDIDSVLLKAAEQ